MIKECYANFECRLANGSIVSKYDLFIWEVLKAHVASSPKYPKTALTPREALWKAILAAFAFFGIKR